VRTIRDKLLLLCWCCHGTIMPSLLLSQIIYQCPVSGSKTWHNEYLIDRGTTFDVANARLAEEVSRCSITSATCRRGLRCLILHSITVSAPAGCCCMIHDMMLVREILSNRVYGCCRKRRTRTPTAASTSCKRRTARSCPCWCVMRAFRPSCHSTGLVCIWASVASRQLMLEHHIYFTADTVHHGHFVGTAD
jgi:hypothetical protein